MNQTEITSLIYRLREIPSRIEETQSVILKKSQELQKVSNEILLLETTLKSDIAAQVDDSGKKSYSNEDARRAAFIESANSSLELGNLKEKSSQLDLEIQQERIAFDLLNNEQRNIRAILQFFSGEFAKGF